MNAMTSRSNSLFDDFFTDLAPGFFIRPLHGDPLPSPAQIKVDVQEDAQAYNVVAELPGVKKEDIQVSVEGSTVTLRAEIKQEDQRKDARAQAHRPIGENGDYGRHGGVFQATQSAAGKRLNTRVFTDSRSDHDPNYCSSLRRCLRVRCRCHSARWDRYKKNYLRAI